jgi:hypothetical protein
MALKISVFFVHSVVGARRLIQDQIVFGIGTAVDSVILWVSVLCVCA